MTLEEKARAVIMAYARSAQYGTYFTEQEMVTDICRRWPFFSYAEMVSKVIRDLIKEEELIEHDGKIKANTLQLILKNWIELR